MIELGLLKEVHFHQSLRNRITTRRIFFELLDVNAMDAPRKVLFAAALRNGAGVSLLNYVNARKSPAAAPPVTASASTIAKYAAYAWPGKCEAPHPVALPAGESIADWHCTMDCNAGAAGAQAATPGGAAAAAAAPAGGDLDSGAN